ncbi:MAG: FAD:protein FMN transferase [Candidatus Hadarchaeales archaeon]
MKMKIIALAQAMATLSGSLFWLVLALLLHPFAFGEVGYFFSISMLLSTIASLGLGKSLIVSKFPDPERSLYLTLISSTALGLPLTLLHPGAGLLVLGFSLFSLSFHLQLARKNFSGYLRLWIARSALLILPLLLYLLLQQTWAIFLGLFLAHFLPSLAVLSRPSVTIVTSAPKQNARVAIVTPKLAGYLLTDLGSASLGFLDKVVAGHLLGMEILGLYYFSSRLLYLFAALPQTLFFYSLSTQSKGMRSLALKSSLLLLAGGLGFSLLLPRLFPDYSGSLRAFQLMLLALVPATLSQVCSAELLSEQRPASTSSAYAITVPLQLLSVVALGRRFGLTGLAASFLLTQCLLTILLILIPRLGRERRRAAVGAACLLVLLPVLVSHLSLPRFEFGRDYVRAEDLAMDTFVRITACDENLEKAREAVQLALREVHELEDLLSCEKEGTEIWKLNHSGTEWVELSPKTYQVLQEALRYAELSDGAFDPTVKPLVDLWMKKVKERGRLPSTSELQGARELVDWRALVLENGRARFLKEGMQVTLGGIAKGYAADLACEILRSRVEAGMVQIGGEIRVFGKPWRIGIQHPRKPEEILQTIELSEGAVSTSGDYVRVYFLGARRIHHIIDPRTGEPATQCQSVTVVASRGIDADPLSTASFVLGPENGRLLLERLGAFGLFVDSSGNLLQTENWGLLVV